MQPIEINAGRCYLRPLHNDDRINDVAALTQIDPSKGHNYIAQRTQDWLTDSAYRFAICEQTQVEASGEIVVELHDDNTATVTGTPVGDPERVPPNDPILEPISVGTAVAQSTDVVRRWVEGQLGRTLRA